GQTAALQNLRLDKPAQTLLFSRDGYAVKQTISERPSALPGLFEIVSKPMRHDCHSDRLDVFGKDHLPSMHQRPGLRSVEQCEPGARREPGAMTLSRSIQQVLQIIE